MHEFETTEQAMKFLASVVNRMNHRETAGVYLDYINKYLENGTIPELEDNSSPLFCYVVRLMKSPFIQLMVFSEPAMAVIFRATTMRYVVARLNQMNFHRQCAQSAAREIQRAYQYSPNMCKLNWNALVAKAAEQYEDFGFDKKFMESLLDNDGSLEPQKWNKLIIDWTTAFQRKLEHQDAQTSSETQSFKAIEYIFKDVKSYIQSSHISDMEAFEQSVNVMHGIWSRSDYERVQPIIRRQKQYPSIKEVVDMMGRIADEDGHRNIPIVTGSSIRLIHSSGSDIEGITSTRQLNSLLPTELAFYSDQQLSDIFWYRYMQGTLQSFRYQSNIAKPTRQLSNKVKAKQKGPMIVCVDTSGSMSGEPIRIAQSILARVVWMANKQCRRCYLIYYSTHIKVIDMHLNNWAFDELKSIAEGGTDATEMLTEIFRLLNTNEYYMCADVLWISDFQVPDVDKSLLIQLNEFRKTETRFYGYKIGGNDSIWDTRLNKMYTCHCCHERKL